MCKPTKIMLLFACLTVLFVTASGFGLLQKEVASLNKISNNTENVDQFLSLEIENSFLALAYEKAISNDDIATAKYLNTYIEQTFDFNVLNEHVFDKFSNTQVFIDLKEKYLVHPDTVSMLYFYIACVGFFFAFVLVFKKKSDLYSRILIATFILIHSLFIFEAFLYFSNYRLRVSKIYMISSSVAFLYGPSLYFYFKRAAQQYSFRWVDLLHFIPTVVLLIILFPVYSLPSNEKIEIMLGLNAQYKIQDFFSIIFIPKVVSLFIYGYFISKAHFNKENRKILKKDCVIYNWENTIYRIHIVYLFSYIIYGLSISEILFVGPSYIYHIQIIAMSAMVIYIISMVYYEPRVLIIKQINILLNAKYQKSALTNSLSLELKKELIKLLEDEKIYRDNTINLQEISNKLGTTRHSASQVINEHFNMNFFELINKFRIHEAMKMLVEDANSNLKIIEVAYEAGFNNKATFNKAFKKETSLTPSEFIKQHRLNFK